MINQNCWILDVGSTLRKKQPKQLSWGAVFKIWLSMRAVFKNEKFYSPTLKKRAVLGLFGMKMVPFRVLIQVGAKTELLGELGYGEKMALLGESFWLPFFSVYVPENSIEKSINKINLSEHYPKVQFFI